MTGRTRTTAFIVACGLLVAAAAMAGVPSPINSTLPSYIDVVGTNTGVPDPWGTFTIVVRDLGGNPIANSQVVLDFLACADMNLCWAEVPGQTVDTLSKTVRGFTDAFGSITFTVLGAARNTGAAAGPGGGCVNVLADGVSLIHATATEIDENGAISVNGVEVTDLSAWLKDLGTGFYLGRSDFNHNASVDIIDLSVWLGRLGTGASTSGCDTVFVPPFRMIRNTGVGRFEVHTAAVTCDAAGGFTHWGHSGIPWWHNTANQGAGKAAALQNALATWTNVNGADHILTYAGTTTAGYATDAKNVLVWRDSSICTGTCLALTALVLVAGQVITESDIMFNNSKTWRTDSWDYDVETVAAHELGHSLGIYHPAFQTTPTQTMWNPYFGIAARDLAPDDIAALQCSQSKYPPAPIPQLVAAAFARQAAAGSTRLTLESRPRAGGALLRFALPAEDVVRLEVYDVAGRSVATLAEGPRPAGEHELAWQGETASGMAHAGVYFARLVASRGEARTTVVLIK